jgi:hypothetical protein
MSPVAHALSLIVPALGLFRVHAHFRLINKLCSARGVSAGITPVAAVMAMTAVTILLIVRVGVGAAGMLGWIAIAITAAVIAMGQRGLNRLWSQQFGTAARPEVTTGEWVVLGAWAFLWLVGLGLVRFGRAMS